MDDRRITILMGGTVLNGNLNDSATADAVWEALPLRASTNIWGNEIYFEISVHAEPENAQAAVALGDIGYWPPGNALCFFFGPTPMSQGDEIRPTSPVNVIGHMEGNQTLPKTVGSGKCVIVERM